MRKNRTKHEAKKPRLAKRALALCFALIFVCSCLLPVFAHSEENLLTQEAVAQQESVDNPTEGGEDPVLLNEGGEDSNEEPKNEEPKPVEPEQKPAEPEQKPEEPKVEEQPKTEGATEESKDTTGETKPEEPKTEETKPEEQPKTEGTTEESKDSTEEPKTEEPKQPTTNTTGDTIEQGKATYTYRFWPDKIDAFELEAINDAVKKGGETLNDAAQSRAGMVPCTVLTVMTNANLRDYQANVQQPTKDGYEFAGWYTVDGTTEDEFSFEQSLNFEESETIDVFAKWVSVAEKNAEKYRGWYENLVNTSDEYMLSELAAEYFADKDFYSYLGSLPENEQAELWEKLEPVNMPEVDEAELEDEAVSLEDEGDEGIALLSITAPEKKITVGKKLILTSNKKAYQEWWGRYWQADHSWTTSNPAVAKVESGKLYQTEKAVVTGMAAGTAIITHTVKWWYYDNKGNRVDDSTTQDTYNVTVVTQTLGDDKKAAVFLLKTPTSDPKSNAPSEWAPNDGAIRWIGEVNVYGALWENNKNINSYAAQHVTKWPDGTTGSSWILTKENTKIFKDNKTYFEDVLDIIFNQYKDKIEEEIRKKNPTLTDNINLTKNDITQIKVTPYKISKNNRSNPDMHIDCTIDVVNDKVYTAKFWVLYPGATSYTQVDAASYLKEQQVAKTSKKTVGSTTAYEGIDYVLKGWYKENTQHKGAPDDLDAATGTLILNSEWSYRPSTDELEDGTVNFYAEYVPDNSATEDLPYIIVEKEVKGLTNVNLLRSDFCITIDGTKYPVSSKYGEIVHTAEGFKIRWKISADTGSYTVDEEKYDVSGYKVVNDGTGTVTTKTPDITFSNPVIHPSCSNQDFTVKSTGQEEIIFVIALHTGQQNTNLVISCNPLSAGVREAIKGKLNSTFMGSGDWNNSKTEFYSIATNGEKFVVANTIVTYNETTGKIHIGEKCNWTKTATLEWSKSGGINPEISITNTYTPATTSLTVTKTATKDGVEDTTEEFDFTLTLGEKSLGATWTKGTDHGTVEGTSHEFTLKGGESITFSGISVEDTNVKVTEDNYSAQHYTTTIKVNDQLVNEAAISADTLKRNQEAGTVTTVEFTNAYTTPKLPSMTIKKVVTGAFGERTKEFNFSVKLENTTNPTLLNGVTVSGAVTNKDNLDSFKLKHGKQVTLENIPIGTTITITETDADEYKTKATDHGESKDRIFVYEVVKGKDGNAVLKAKNSILGLELDRTVKDNAITVTNDFDGNPDTGVLLDTLPYLILLAVAVAGGVLVVVRKRKHRDE